MVGFPPQTHPNKCSGFFFPIRHRKSLHHHNVRDDVSPFFGWWVFGFSFLWGVFLGTPVWEVFLCGVLLFAFCFWFCFVCWVPWLFVLFCSPKTPPQPTYSPRRSPVGFCCWFFWFFFLTFCKKHKQPPKIVFFFVFFLVFLGTYKVALFFFLGFSLLQIAFFCFVFFAFLKVVDFFFFFPTVAFVYALLACFLHPCCSDSPIE